MRETAIPLNGVVDHPSPFEELLARCGYAPTPRERGAFHRIADAPADVSLRFELREGEPPVAIVQWLDAA